MTAPVRFAALKGAAAVGYAVGAFAITALSGVAAVAHYTAATHGAVIAHEAADMVRDRASAARDTSLLTEVKAMHRDQLVSSRKQTCVLVAETTAEKRACQRHSFVEAP